MTRLLSYWRWPGHRLRLSGPGRVLFTVALLAGVAGMAVARAHGDREGGAPLVVLALLLAGVITLDAVGRGVVAVARRLIVDGADSPASRSTTTAPSTSSSPVASAEPVGRRQAEDL